MVSHGIRQVQLPAAHIHTNTCIHTQTRINLNQLGSFKSYTAPCCHVVAIIWQKIFNLLSIPNLTPCGTLFCIRHIRKDKIIRNNMFLQFSAFKHFIFLFLHCLFSVWPAVWRQIFGRLSNASCALENQEWPVHTATYLPKWSWRLINTCDPFPCRMSKWDF